MRLNRIAAGLRAFFRLGVNTTSFSGDFYVPPAGQQGVDNTAMSGLIGGLLNANESNDMDLVALAGGTATAITLTGAQATAQVLDYSGSPGSGVTMTTPTAAQMIAALPPTIPKTGYNFMHFLINDSAGQTVTLTAGSNVTITGTATVLTATVRIFCVNVNPSAGTVNYVNMGGWSL